ncbi:Iron-sulfur cluster biogenesis protein [Chloropicon primus]|uniref:Iron-sulfur cluster biogenesis protein n=1 Tax=Chloropicon primus TaxID=1764295 RepID=A0A5B8MDZ4_9CHLO|nr:Iron-sulfur cluster biogenesis protein [Chloropicon primus]UPQ96788.1 Iron-sulfur cluster biogenesis protein [Chloropicon primus]|mmetsp:Transcript_3610/g.10202  ORF Transcript_3610/g.10202 Transcript_3610/m.10202 type:complete len:173 (+) Transcript_3610:57-575(+)|eukprot:QDZ17570.1 Iron-sulfur cluster biogenesis protein [Chloropicon primus]
MSLLRRLSEVWRGNLFHYRLLRAERLRSLALGATKGDTDVVASLALRKFSGEAEAEEDTDAIHITDACVARIRELRKDGAEGESKDNLLRVRVDSGGCSGFQYTFDMDTSTKEGDRVFSKEDVKIVVDEVSMQFLKGATVDYVEELIKESFEITSNPNAESSCGCGSSFVPT